MQNSTFAVLVEWSTAGVFGLAQEVYFYGFNLSSFVICDFVSVLMS